MPTIAPAIVRSGANLEMRLVQWAALAAGDDGGAVDLPDQVVRSVQVRGTFGGATVTFEGSNEAVPTNWTTLTAPGGAAISLTSAGLRQVVEYTRWVRPLVTGGTAVAVTVELVAR